jgi:Domain of unknown function (DUF4157)
MYASASLTRSAPGRAADRRPAETWSVVRRPPVWPLPAASRPLLQRCGAGPCDCDGRQEDGEIQRKPAQPGRTTQVPPAVHAVLGSPGAPLTVQARSFFEPRFGQDFSSVRVHTGARAAASARAVGARGYTVGNDIVLAEDEPATQGRVLAHELAHVIQQGGRVSGRARLAVGEADRFTPNASALRRSA